MVEDLRRVLDHVNFAVETQADVLAIAPALNRASGSRCRSRK
jgi:hypothetical protein